MVFFLKVTNCKCSWMRDLLNKADIFQNNNDKTSCHAAYIIWNIYIYIEYSNAVRSYNWCVSACRPFCARRMGPSGFHTLSDITWSIVYNAVPEIRLAGSVSVEWFLLSCLVIYSANSQTGYRAEGGAPPSRGRGGSLTGWIGQTLPGVGTPAK